MILTDGQKAWWRYIVGTLVALSIAYMFATQPAEVRKGIMPYIYSINSNMNDNFHMAEARLDKIEIELKRHEEMFFLIRKGKN